MSFTEPQSPSGAGIKRARSSSLDLEELQAHIAYNPFNVTIPQSKNANDLTLALIQKIKDGAYTHNLLPNEVSEALTNFLTNTKLCVDNNYVIHRVVPPSEDEELLDCATKAFNTAFSQTKMNLCNRIKQTAPKDFISKLAGHDLDKFRTIRNLLTKWFITCQHLEMKLNNKTNSRDYVRLNLSFSTNFDRTDLKDYCDKEMASLKLKMERKLTLAKTNECLEMTKEININIDEMLNTDHTLLLRAFRAVILNNKHIAKELLSYVPIGPTYVPMTRPYKSNHTNPWHQTERRQSNKDRQVSNRSDMNDPPPHRREARSYRSRRYERDRDRHQYQYVSRNRKYSRQDNWDRRRFMHRGPQDRYNERTDSYNDDFPEYDGNYKQKKQRYRSDQEDDVFEPQQRRPPERYKRWS